MPTDYFDPRDPDCLRDVIRRFREKRSDYELLASYLCTVRLPKIAARLGIYPIIMGRAKSLESFAEKIQRPSKDYKRTR